MLNPFAWSVLLPKSSKFGCCYVFAPPGSANFLGVRGDENPETLPFPPEAQSLLMRAAIAASMASKRLAEDPDRGMFHLTPAEWASLEASTQAP